MRDKNFNKLPKLQVELVEQDTREMDMKSFASFVDVCRTICSIAEPYLYKAISLTPPNAAYREVLILLGAICKPPRMASRTETLNMEEPEKDTSDVMELAQMAGLDTQPSANESISHLLSKLPNLRSLFTSTLPGAIRVSL
ncbi:conserved hypothetical protein [Histoplasma capsulatum var. duboisii H88]|uniref:Uncharacterized protein n=2 Tax=Ajellomyces capsulatus TaxID=5037 RepID=F0UDR5_AJEC8|nr:conserved hypothetical protein [Histoplasma capsulatum H143]EGC44488.1 conserved hypothetical protein [Histoplasma capsulatum var. duboisii H88]